MDLERALLAAIQADPGEDSNWAVLADWLDDTNQPARADLVRLFLQLRRPTGDGVRPSLEHQLRDLVATGFCLPLPRRRLDIGPDLALEFVQIPPGSFLMGTPLTEERRDEDEGPVHPVTLTRPFWLGIFPVTQAQWETVTATQAPGRFRGGDRPVDGISWHTAMEFVSDLQARFRWNCQLPTEAQWEYACRGLTSTPFHYGPDLSSLEANFDGNFPYGAAPTGPWLHQTSPRGTYRPNLFGLFDMHGNVWEWCADWYDDSYYTRSPVRDPAGPPTGVLRVLRGGSWYSYSWTCRSGGRERFSPDSGSGNYGFRLAMQDD